MGTMPAQMLDSCAGSLFRVAAASAVGFWRTKLSVLLSRRLGIYHRKPLPAARQHLLRLCLSYCSPFSIAIPFGFRHSDFFRHPLAIYRSSTFGIRISFGFRHSASDLLRRLAGGDRVANLRWLKLEAFDRCLGVFQARQVGPHESVAKHVSNRGEDVHRPGFGDLAGKRNECAELISWAIVKQTRSRSDQGLPKELQNVIFLDVLGETEDLKVAEQRFYIAGHLPLFGVGLDDEIEPATLEIEFAILEGKVVNLGDVKPQQ